MQEGAVSAGAVPHPAAGRPALHIWQGSRPLQQEPGGCLLQAGAKGEHATVCHPHAALTPAFSHFATVPHDSAKVKTAQRGLGCMRGECCVLLCMPTLA